MWGCGKPHVVGAFQLSGEVVGSILGSPIIGIMVGSLSTAEMSNPSLEVLYGMDPGRAGSQAWKQKSEPGLESRPWNFSLVLLWMQVMAGGSLLAGVSPSLGLGALSWIRAKLLGQQQA